MPERDIVVIGGSAGALFAAKEIVRRLPPDFSAAIFLVIHVPPHGTSVIPTILSRIGTLPAYHASEGQLIKKSAICVAPPDRHLLIYSDRVYLGNGPKENNSRPAVDPLFRSAALSFGARTVGVLLSGSLDDGTAGLAALKRVGGLAMVQDPSEAEHSGMPESAIQHVEIDFVGTAAEIAEKLKDIVGSPSCPAVGVAQAFHEKLRKEIDVARFDPNGPQPDENSIGAPSKFACPDCGGALWEISEGSVLTFRCRVGHAYGAETLAAKQSDALEEALWVALRAIEESRDLSLKVAQRSENRGNTLVAERFRSQAEKSESNAQVIRSILANGIRNRNEKDAEKED